MSYIGRSPQIGAYSKLDAITTDGSASYTMQLDSANFVPESVNHLIVSVNGVIQAPTDSFTVSGSTITFASSLSVSDTIDFIMALGNVLDIGVPSDATVSLSKLTATGTKDATTFLRGDNTFAVPSGGVNTPMFLAYAGANVNVSSGSNTQVQLNSELYDTDNGFNTSTYRYTVQEAGYYFLFYHYRWEEAGDFDDQKVWVSYNSSVYTSDNIMSSWGANHYYTKMGSYEIRQLASGDTLELFSYQSTGVVRTLAGSDDFGLNTVFGGFKLVS